MSLEKRTMVDEDVETHKRRRVTQACETCRSLKSKCDGKKPTCGRCRGYGYICRWKDRNNRFATTDALRVKNEGTAASTDDPALAKALRESTELLRRLRENVNADDQAVIDSTLTNINDSRNTTSAASRPTLPHRADVLASQRNLRQSNAANRYLGEVSDVSFFNTVRDVLRGSASSFDDDMPLESYEREAADASDTSDDKGFETPDRDVADEYLDIYFSTIHVAYNFMFRQQFMQDYSDWWALDRTQVSASPLTPVLLTIFAIGAYYKLCTLPAGQDTAQTHSVFFRRAQLSGCHPDGVRSLNNVRLLLLQCFYLLATCQTDRCWMTLGLAIRIGQSIGIHIDCRESSYQKQWRGGPILAEFRRRTWQSLYVLDRLLSLQLGRPSAIRTRDCNVHLPSNLGDEEFDLANDRIPESHESEPKVGDYFVAVIKFSRTIGHVVRDLYRPSMMDYSEDMLSRTDRLDAELLAWKRSLPRWLRFDRGHTFERSPVLKRQRNMLAIKFHHLRTLIHRPYLCLPWLQGSNSNIKSLLDSHSHRVVSFESVCVQEAQATAHMLHDVTDTKTLVEDFPWWQMISCLLCASSILLVMRTFAYGQIGEDKTEQDLLEEDADTCFKVFEALSINSDAARLARDMLGNLRDIKVDERESLADTILQPAPTRQEKRPEVAPGLTMPWPRQAHIGSEQQSTPEANRSDIGENGQSDLPYLWQWPTWPSEMADSMMWSSQFLDTVDPAELTRTMW